MTSEEEARARVVESVVGYAEACGYEGVVTGFVICAELTGATGVPSVIWVTGTGATPTDADDAGIGVHRAEGMARWMMRHWTKGDE